jgi:hypothetical protein
MDAVIAENVNARAVMTGKDICPKGSGRIGLREQ